MTTPVPPNAVSLSDATGILLAGRPTWITLAPGTLTAVLEPTFTDSLTGAQIAPGELWFQFTDTAGQAYAAPRWGIAAIQLAAPIT
jgi:hypothetical protein